MSTSDVAIVDGDSVVDSVGDSTPDGISEHNRSGGAPASAPLRPRTRWAAIVWGLVFAGVAIGGIALTSTPTVFAEVVAWAAWLDAGTAVGYGLLVIGALVLVVGVIGLLRRAQLAVAARGRPGPFSKLRRSALPFR